MADNLLNCKPAHDSKYIPSNRFGSGFGKSKFPEITSTTCLSNLVGDLWFTGDLLKLDATFLQVLVEDKLHIAAFQTSRQKVFSQKVVNDSAERPVKLSNDFLSSARWGIKMFHKLLKTTVKKFQITEKIF